MAGNLHRKDFRNIGHAPCSAQRSVAEGERAAGQTDRGKHLVPAKVRYGPFPPPENRILRRPAVTQAASRFGTSWVSANSRNPAIGLCQESSRRLKLSASESRARVVSGLHVGGWRRGLRSAFAACIAGSCWRFRILDLEELRTITTILLANLRLLALARFCIKVRRTVRCLDRCDRPTGPKVEFAADASYDRRKIDSRAVRQPEKAAWFSQTG